MMSEAIPLSKMLARVREAMVKMGRGLNDRDENWQLMEEIRTESDDGFLLSVMTREGFWIEFTGIYAVHAPETEGEGV